MTRPPDFPRSSLVAAATASSPRVLPTPPSPCCRRATVAIISRPAGASAGRSPNGSSPTSTAVRATSPTRPPSARRWRRTPSTSARSVRSAAATSPPQRTRLGAHRRARRSMRKASSAIRRQDTAAFIFPPNATAASIRCCARGVAGTRRTRAGRSWRSPSRICSRVTSGAVRSARLGIVGPMRGRRSLGLCSSLANPGRRIGAPSSRSMLATGSSAATASDQQPGFVEVVATPGGRRGAGTEERRFLVPSDEYRMGRFR